MDYHPDRELLIGTIHHCRFVMLAVITVMAFVASDATIARIRTKLPPSGLDYSLAHPLIRAPRPRTVLLWDFDILLSA